MDTEVLDNFERFVNILKTGGPYAVSALFFLMWFRADRLYRKVMMDLKDIAVAKVESDVKTERTLQAGNHAMEGVKDQLTSMGSSISGMSDALRQILLLKTKKLSDGNKPNGDDN